VITLLTVISTDGAMGAPPRVNLRGVVTTADARKLSIWAEREITWVLENRWNQLCRHTGGTAPDVDWVGVQREIEVGLQRRLRRELQVEPLIICLVQPAPAGTPAYKGRADAEPDSRPGWSGVGRPGRSGNQPGDHPQRRLRSEAAPAAARQAVATLPAPAAATATAAPVAAVTPVVKAAPAVSVPAEPEMPANRVRRRRSTAAG